MASFVLKLQYQHYNSDFIELQIVFLQYQDILFFGFLWFGVCFNHMSQSSFRVCKFHFTYSTHQTRFLSLFSKQIHKKTTIFCLYNLMLSKIIFYCKLFDQIKDFVDIPTLLILGFLIAANMLLFLQEFHHRILSGLYRLP